FIRPRNSSFWLRHTSASSRSSVGVYFSIVRKSAAGEILAEASGHFASFPIIARASDFPHRSAGAVTLTIGAASDKGSNHVAALQKAIAIRAADSQTINRENVASISSRSAVPLTASGHDSGSGNSSG